MIRDSGYESVEAGTTVAPTPFAAVKEVARGYGDINITGVAQRRFYGSVTRETGEKEVVILPKSPNTHDIYLEIGKKKVFAGAVEWPGWCRPGRDEGSAIQALLDAGARYSQILESSDLGFEAPEEASSFTVVERLAGNATTDFGAPDIPLSSDKDPIDASELQRLQTLLKASWVAFDEAVKMADGKELRKGPRGGGRDLQGIIDHVLGADASYLRRLGWKMEKVEEDEVEKQLARIRRAILDGLVAAADGQLPERGPRGGKRWVPRFFVRRVAWHVIDHAWEIEARIIY